MKTRTTSIQPTELQSQKRILFVADIGSNDQGFYHIGDEAMLTQTYFWYKNNFPKMELGLVSRSISHSKFTAQEQLHLPFPQGTIQTRLYFLRLMLKDFLWRAFKKSTFTETERQFIHYVLSFDALHFTGGGNFYSHYRPWLYYLFFLLYLGKTYRKRIWLTSQTLGPFTFFDSFLAHIFLGFSDCIALREPPRSKSLHRPLLYRKNIFGMLDSAYSLSDKSTYQLSPTHRLRIGLSLHEWDYEKNIKTSILSALQSLSEDSEIELILIPHILAKQHQNWDIKYMQELLHPLPPSVRIVVPTYTRLTTSSFVPEFTIKALTKQVDILISTRYHGVIFALSENVPVLTFSFGKYYAQKNTSALQMIYGQKAEKYLIDLGIEHPGKILAEKAHYLIKHLEDEKHILKDAVIKAKRDKKLFTLDDLGKVEKIFQRYV